jgi:hypothetical protein
MKRCTQMEWVIEPKKFRHKRTGEITTQIPLLDIGNYEEMKSGGLGTAIGSTKTKSVFGKKKESAW